MATATFVLKEPKKETSLILLVFRYGNSRLNYSTRFNTPPHLWLGDSVKKSHPNSSEINHRLPLLESGVKTFYHKLVNSREEVSNQRLIEELDKLIQVDHKPKVQNLSFFDCLKLFIEEHSLEQRERTIKKFRTLFLALQRFQKEKRCKITFETVNREFYTIYKKWLINDCEYLNSTVNKYITNLKTFLNWATDEGYNQNLTFRSFKRVKDEGPDIVYLTDQELTKLMELEIQNPRLRNVRDVFCFGCYTGLRFSDIENLRSENVKEGSLLITAIKTQQKIKVPLDANAMRILQIHNYQLPVISNQKTNNYLKELGEVAGFTDEVTINRNNGAKVITEVKHKYELLTTHTARRTFVTLSLEKGMRPEVVMLITGHQDIRTLQKYIKITSEVAEEEMKKAWGNTPLKVAV